MNSTTLIIVGSVAALILQTVTLVGVVWKGGNSLGRMEEALSRTVIMLDRLEDRVGKLEGR